MIRRRAPGGEPSNGIMRRGATPRNRTPGAADQWIRWPIRFHRTALSQGIPPSDDGSKE